MIAHLLMSAHGDDVSPDVLRKHRISPEEYETYLLEFQQDRDKQAKAQRATNARLGLNDST